MGLHLVAVFGPTGIGKTGTAIELAALLRERGEDPVAINCDAIQVYEGLETISGAASAEEQRQLEHRLLGFVPLSDEFSAGKYADRAHAEIDGLLAEGRRPILVGGTGLYLRAALAEIAFRPAVPEALRQEVERELEAEGAAALHASLPVEFQEAIHPNDRKRIARTVELIRDGQTPARNHQGGGDLWTASLRKPSLLFGLAEEDDVLVTKIDRRIDAMAAAGAAAEVERADQGGASRTARAAIGFTEFLTGDLERLKLLHRRYGRRQMTWMRRMEGIRMIERRSRPDRQVAAEILAGIDSIEGQNADSVACG
ncbi:MAG: tRNA (adenosine(37)-N6)-dimethylallyltransferase MiaA [Solirubrobacterales bacterium]